MLIYCDANNDNIQISNKSLYVGVFVVRYVN